MSLEQSETSREEVHDALENLYDNIALAECALAERFRDVSALENVVERAQHLRAIILEAIEVLRPARRAAFGSREARACDVLTLRYVERLSISEMEEELDLGRRQLFRDLGQAEEKLAQVLQEWATATDLPLPAVAMVDTLSGELAALATQPSEVNLLAVLEEAIDLLQPLARELQISLDCHLPERTEVVMATRSILKQVLVQLLSWAMQTAEKPQVKLAAVAGRATTRVSVLFWPKVDIVKDGKIAGIESIAGHEGIRVEVKDAKSVCEVVLVMRRQRSPVALVVEDNPGALELYRRYLSGGNWQLKHVADSRLAFEVAKRESPDLIILDIMMPHVDGWSVLQTLRQRPETSSIPILVCSVVEDEELSRVLGATVSLKKPVSQGDFLASLHQCLHSRGGS